MSDDLGRYESAVGWEPKDPYKKQRERMRKQQLREAQPSDTMLETRPASEWIKRGSKRNPPAELYGSLWREGELALFFGDKGSGKSILAVQLAESIARGRPALSVLPEPAGRALGSKIRSPQSALRNRKVLYLDFEHTERQFAERYSAPSPIPGKLPMRHRFPKNFIRAAIDWHSVEPGKDLACAIQSAIFSKIEESGAKVIITDDILLGGANAMRPNGFVRTMQTLKMWAATQDLSILVIAHAKPRRSGPAVSSPVSRLVSLQDLAHSRQIADLADSVFAIARSTFGPEYRYVKHLAAPSADTLAHTDAVLSYQLGRTTGAQASRLHLPPPVSCLPSHSLPISPSPFLSLTYLGPSAESDHLRDYEKEAREIERIKDLRSKNEDPRSKRSLVEMLLSRQYQRYLEK